MKQLLTLVFLSFLITLTPSFVFANDSNDEIKEIEVESNESSDDISEENQEETTVESSTNLEEASDNEADETIVVEEENAESNSEIPVVEEETTEPTYEEWLSVVESEESYVDRLTLFNESYDEWQEEETFLTDFYNTLVASMELASEKHLESDFPEAITYYEAILASKEVPEDLIEEASWKKEFAEEEQAYPIADEMYETANAARTASAKLAAFTEGYNVFSEDERFTEGVHYSAQNLFNWAVTQEEKGNVETAMDRYETILNTPTLPEGLEQSIQERLEALEKEPSSPEVTNNSVTIQQRSADVIYTEATNERTASGKLQLYTEGLNAYPKDSRFITGVESSAQSLLSWARGKHQAGDFATAKDRYETILATSGISPLLNETTKKHLAYANDKKSIPSANTLLDEANKQTKASALFTHFHSALTWYPTDSRFQKGLNTAAKNLLSWAESQHDQGKFDTAKSRYQMIIDTPSVSSDITENATSLMAAAEAGKRSADAIYQSAVKEYRASHKLALFSDGYTFYPNDTRFRDGVHQSAASLLTWAIGKHNLADYETAIDRYEAILAAPTLSSAVESETKTKLANAEQGKRPADVIYEAAQNIRTATGLFEAYQEGYAFYPNDSRFKTGLASSSQTLLDLAKRYHQQGDYNAAKSRYKVLLETNGVPKSIQDLTKIQQNFADSNQRIPTLASYTKYAQEQTTASGILTAYLEGYLLYDGDSEMAKGLKNATRNLLNWASSQHQNGRYDTALDRYETILGLPVLDSDLVTETEIKKSYADKGLTLPSANKIYTDASSQSSASHQLSGFIEGYTLYPTDKRFHEGINSGAQSLLNWASRQQADGNFETAIDRYKTILAAPLVNYAIINETEFRLASAENGEKVPSADSLYNQAKKETTLSGILEKFTNGYLLYPNDQRFIGGVNAAAQNLLTWATTQHNEGRFSVAQARYETIMSTPGIDAFIEKQASIQLDYASKKQALPDRIQIGTINVNSTLNVRTGPSGSYSILGTLPDGALVNVVSQHSSGWFQINFNGKTAYVSGNYVDLVSIATVPNSGPLSGRTIVLDAGHGGPDPGAQAGGMEEKELILDITLRAQKLLEEAGATVIMVRSTDVFYELRERSAIANASGADVFVSIHANAYNGTANGTETFYHTRFEAALSKKLAHALQDATIAKLGTNYRRVAEGNFHVIRETKIPSALLEVGFMDHTGDAAKLRQSSYRQRSAEGILNGLVNYFN
ncbi:hypothetical protein CR203_05935 [Salipaludibacillus neizhouensis]|uniref:SH3b domain-containing protein n=1 Tax=Salipaludibacillus neizhouensis TaxID=885475 RepID=A0A3A9K633_9BACI|nr:N-acetylmuramoyl-L-alanine amidase [Salipaludibacillus neizhouensis]RKL68037.1 hypothetical protein CR203_05935 [Salipaludibacillus neizhouensis]